MLFQHFYLLLKHGRKKKMVVEIILSLGRRWALSRGPPCAPAVGWPSWSLRSQGTLSCQNLHPCSVFEERWTRCFEALKIQVSFTVSKMILISDAPRAQYITVIKTCVAFTRLYNLTGDVVQDSCCRSGGWRLCRYRFLGPQGSMLDIRQQLFHQGY